MDTQMASDKEVHMIMQLAGVDEETATKMYLEHESIEDVLDALIQRPAVSGDKYIPAKPKIDSGLSSEQEALCQRGRWLQDKVNVVFSAAHSKTRTLQDEASSPEVLAHDRVPPSSPQQTAVAALPVLPQDFDEKTSQRDSQSETPLQTHS